MKSRALIVALFLALVPVSNVVAAESVQVLAADFDGDGRPDPVVIGQGSNGRLVWVMNLSSKGFAVTSQFTWGLNSDLVVVIDFDGDGISDPTVYRPSEGKYYSFLSSCRCTRIVAVAVNP